MSNKNKIIYSVTEVKLTILKMPQTFEITARGTTRTTGWSNGYLLNDFVYAGGTPEDGIYDFHFYATPPGGIVEETITNINSKSFTWKDYPKSLKGVRVHSETNKIEKKLFPSKQ